MKSLFQQRVNSGKRIRGFYYGYVIVASALVSTVAIYMVTLSYGIFFKPMALELNINRTATSGAFSLCRIMSGATAVLMGWLVDKAGARLVLVISAVLTAVGSILMSRLMTTGELYLVYGLVLGVGSGIFAPMVALVAKWFVRRRALLTGIVICAMGIASFVGPPVANVLIINYGWRIAYIVMGIVVGIVVLVAAQFMKKEPGPQQSGVSATGVFPEKGETSAPVCAYSLGQALCTHQFWIFFVMSICFAYCYMAGFIHIAPYITDLHASSSTAAISVAVIGIADVVGLVLIGNVGDTIGHKKTIAIGFALLLLAMCSLLLLKNPAHFVIFSVLLGLAYGSIASQRPPLIASMFGVKAHGLIFGVADNSFTVGAAIGPIITGYIYDVAGDYHMAFIVGVIISAVGLVLSFMLRSDGGASR